MMGLPTQIRVQKLTIDTEDGYTLQLERFNETTNGLTARVCQRKGDQMQYTSVTVNGFLLKSALELLGVVGS